MKRFLMVTWDGGGNVTSALGLAQQLVAAGHEVCLLGHRSIESRCGRHGAYFVHRASADHDSAVGFDTDEAEFGFVLDELLFSERSAEMSRAPDAGRDVVVVDSMLLGGCAPGSRSLPTVALFSTAVALFRSGPFAELLSPASRR